MCGPAACPRGRQLLTSWLAEYGIPVLVVRGFASQSYADVVRRRTARHGRATLLWRGDCDASGAEIERDWARRTEDCWDEVRRVFLTHEQTIEYELPPALGKHGDPRWPAFADRHGLDPAPPCNGKWRRWNRPNSSAWSSPPSLRMSTVTSLPGRSHARTNNAEP
ncbi:hypothetical protein ACVWZD_000356 [Streptomyces sp. TE3672]